MRLTDLGLLALLAGTACSEEIPGPRGPRQMIVSTGRNCPVVPQLAPELPRSTSPPQEGHTPAPLDRSGVVSTPIAWNETKLNVTDQSWLGAAAGAAWMRENPTGRIMLSRGGAAARPVARVARDRAFRSAVGQDGQLAVLIGHPASVEPVRSEGVDRLQRFDAAGTKIEDVALGWTATTLSSLAFASNGDLLVTATARHGAQIGDRTIVAPHAGMVELVVRIGRKASVLSVTTIEDALPRSTDRTASSDALWMHARLRDASLDLALIKVDNGEHVFTRALRWRNEGSSPNFPSFMGPLPLADGVVYTGELYNLDWGAGAYLASVRSLVVRLDANGNVAFARGVDQSILTTAIFDQRIFLLLATSGPGFEVVRLDSDGSVLSISTITHPEDCDMGAPALYKGEASVELSILCSPYAEEDEVRSHTMRYFADLGR